MLGGIVGALIGAGIVVWFSAVIVPWAVEHDGESLFEAVKKTFKEKHHD